ncbi:TPM domain-containing protein [Acinetobacter sp. ANC 4633]|uniref:TPM domain-containing protein n=1 Tax=Acinetobacter sp. ANC 4633 TaxID=2529845 RepID=UPI003A4DE381
MLICWSSQLLWADDSAASEATTMILPALDQPVIDQAHVLTVAERQALAQKILTVYQQQKAQIGILIVPTTGQQDIFDYAMRVAEQWKLGRSQQDNGLLMVVAINDHHIQILTGYGLEGVLPDVVLSRIIREQMTPLFQQQQYAKGIQVGLDEIIQILNQDPELAKQAANQLKQQHAEALLKQQSYTKMLSYVVVILIVGVVASLIVGDGISAVLAAVATIIAGWVASVGILMSLAAGVIVFFLLITSLAQLILQLGLSMVTGGGSQGGGGRYRGGGGGFGGGGASGSW